jgi:glycosyltransferase involved in cell wall biosynthesis
MDEPWVLVLGTADWDQPIATNQHFVTRELAREFRVTFVESLGLRRPQVSRRDLRRVRRRLTGARTGAVSRPRPDGVEVLSPRLVPVHVGPVRGFNRAALHRLVGRWSGHRGPRVLWTYSPQTYGLETSAATMYHCVDLLAEVPGIPPRVVLDGERQLSGSGAQAAACTELVRDHLRTVGFADPMLWPNVADVDVYRDAAARSEPVRGRAVFAGNLSPSKVDFGLLEAVARAGVDLHLAGPVAEGGGSAGVEVRRLAAAGATVHGVLAPVELAELYAGATVGLIPYVLNPYTRGVSPLKTYEYLAAGLCVVATPLPGVQPLDGDVLVRSGQEFVDAVVEHAAVPAAAVVDRRVGEAEQHSWTARGEVVRATVRRLVEAR